jgi:hypothetical protein
LFWIHVWLPDGGDSFAHDLEGPKSQ